MIREKDIASAIIAETFDSCKSASIEENRASSNQRIECSGRGSINIKCLIVKEMKLKK